MKLAAALERDEGLAQNPTMIRLAGPLAGLVFPRMCPNCGMAARQKTEVAKVFMRTGGSDRLRRYEIGRVDVPFCDTCLARHRSELEPLTPGQRLWSLFGNELAWPGIGLAALGTFLGVELSGKVLRDPAGSWPVVALLMFFVGAAWLSIRAAWTKGERYRMPAPTSVLSSFDFGDDQSDDFGSFARTYSLRNAAFAAAFVDLNTGVSEALLGQREKARTNRNFIIGLLILAAIIAWQVLNGSG